MRRILLCLFIGLNCLHFGRAQQQELKFHLKDGTTEMPISDVHIFIDNSSVGTTSDLKGYCELSVSVKETQVLIISHLLYEPLILEPERYKQLSKGDTLTLQSNSLDISQILLTAKRSKKWKKRYRIFRRTLLGNDKAAACCKILNPEVLRFDEDNETLSVRAVDVLHIENDYLAYTINFWLEELTIKEDGSSYFKGNRQIRNC